MAEDLQHAQLFSAMPEKSHTGKYVEDPEMLKGGDELGSADDESALQRLALSSAGPDGAVKRNLKQRHIAMIALGGAIGGFVAQPTWPPLIAYIIIIIIITLPLI